MSKCKGEADTGGTWKSRTPVTSRWITTERNPSAFTPVLPCACVWSPLACSTVRTDAYPGESWGSKDTSYKRSHVVHIMRI